MDTNRRNIKATKDAIIEKMNAKNTIVSMGIQKLPVVIGLVSAIISFVAIFVTMMGSEANESFFNENKDSILNVFAFVIAIVIVYYAIKLLAIVRECVLKKIRFR